MAAFFARQSVISTSQASPSVERKQVRHRKFNNVMARLFGLIFRSDRAACITQIKKLGLDGHAKAMAERRTQTLKR
jgi:hypothetical protein